MIPFSIRLFLFRYSPLIHRNCCCTSWMGTSLNWFILIWSTKNRSQTYVNVISADRSTNLTVFILWEITQRISNCFPSSFAKKNYKIFFKLVTAALLKSVFSLPWVNEERIKGYAAKKNIAIFFKNLVVWSFFN